MKKANRIGLPILAIVMCGFLSLRFWPQPEPTYKGKSLTTWLQGSRGSESMKAEADEAVRSMGAKAIPTLLQMLRSECPSAPLKEKSIEIARKLGLLRKGYGFPKGSKLFYPALCGFRALGDVAKDAVPQLDAIFEQYTKHISKSTDFINVQAPRGIVRLLVEMGTPAHKVIPSFIRRTTHKDPLVRAIAIEALGDFHARPELAVPCLVKILYDPSMHVCRLAISSLSKFGAEAKLAIPALADRICATNTIAMLKIDLMQLLVNIHAEPTLALPALIKVLNADDTLVREMASMTLRDYGKEAKSAVPALLITLNDPDPYLRSISQETLKVIAPEAVPNEKLK